MKLSFFAAALIGLISHSEAVSLQGVDFDFADYELAEQDNEQDDYELAQVYDDDYADLELAEVFAEDEDNWLTDEEELAEVSSESESDSESESESETDSNSDSESNSESDSEDLAQISNNSDNDECAACKAAAAENPVTLSVVAPKCQPVEEKKEPFQKAMLSALNELGNKSTQLATALEMQFKKNEKLAASNTMAVSGAISIVPSTSVAARK